jgi:hypothetical protein
MAGPAALLRLVLSEFRVIALLSSPRGAKEGMFAVQEGRIMALPAPRQKVSINSHHSVVISRAVISVRATADASSQTCRVISTVRRLQMSPMTPAG